MTREEAIKILENGGWWDLLIPITTIEGRSDEDKLHQAIDMAISALRSVSREQELEAENKELKERIVNWRKYMAPTREQVEKVWRGEWEWFDEEIGTLLDGYERDWGWRCGKCSHVLPDEYDDPDLTPKLLFCPNCGAPMTDEAVQMVMERLEALHGET